MTTPPSISVETPRAAGIERLLDAGSADARSLYPADPVGLLDASQLEAPGTLVYVARDHDGEALGVAAIVDGDGLDADRGELRRMYVDPVARGRGIASALIERIETDAAARGLREIVLEAGRLHHPALALYAKHGYRRVERFGRYVNEPTSVCMAKSLVGFTGVIDDDPFDLPLAVGE
ncbi:putative acetyltransferase [Agromyces flavus]|uniref:Acetyltransferase n=1 Tax=Agromyces flavus TaxID=589382 RepID=A0A1H1ZTE9_9MICO|nr:GNAT family N-acetyltransferase [Agromyces flavus]MCP2367246.1 putative acetyltransferase [Agromyces flavus]GGI46110.1 N-acetyltransferase [Agromyces flavus]SDT36682.1 putative acetyltransferase [Agromyces flavus]